MSTYFNGLNELFSSVDVSKEGNHTKITIFVKGQNAGAITLSDDNEVSEFLFLLFNKEDAAYQTAHGIVKDPHLNDEDQILSEYGELTTISDIIQNYKTTT